jgi:hypothetical protein
MQNDVYEGYESDGLADLRSSNHELVRDEQSEHTERPAQTALGQEATFFDIGFHTPGITDGLNTKRLCDVNTVAATTSIAAWSPLSAEQQHFGTRVSASD